MARLPQPGSDYNTWGDILNQFLLTEHRANGTHDIKSLLGAPTTTGRVPISDGSARGFSWQIPPSATPSHSGLTGLANDDHVQYHTDARGDARYYTQSQMDVALNAKSDSVHTHSGYLAPSSIIAGTNITVDSITTPGSVIINASGGGGGSVSSVNGDTGDVIVPTFRGQWNVITNDNVLQAYDFASGTFPAGFTTSDANVAVIDYIAPVGGTITPSAPTKVAHIAGASIDSANRSLTLDLSVAAIPNVTKVRFWISVDSEGGYDYGAFSIDGGGSLYSLSGAHAWAQQTAIVPSTTSVLEWTYKKDTSATNGTDSHYVAMIELLEAVPAGPTTYEVGDTVVYQGRFWTCATQYTTSTPGTNSDWTGGDDLRGPQGNAGVVDVRVSATEPTGPAVGTIWVQT